MRVGPRAKFLWCVRESRGTSFRRYFAFSAFDPTLEPRNWVSSTFTGGGGFACGDAPWNLPWTRLSPVFLREV